jgi:hypothetical protein
MMKEFTEKETAGIFNTHVTCIRRIRQLGLLSNKCFRTVHNIKNSKTYYYESAIKEIQIILRRDDDELNLEFVS